ncbi:hypothetical protein HU230_0043190 (plasmid) [Bradyrhizobium quebecense]|nr:hypothetical protein [Bradyrhizobium quebecense]UGA49107.1 hypothetical protein HU230_0043190 [Bradyrhizobium quebecense]
MSLFQEIGLKLKSFVKRSRARQLLEKRLGVFEGFFDIVSIGFCDFLIADRRCFR